MAREAEFYGQRKRMVRTQLVERGISDRAVLDAFSTVPREEFVPQELRRFAHDDIPLPIGDGQTISQPYIVALTLEAMAIEPGDRVLDVGTGSGYAAALAARIAGEVYGMERVERLCRSARARLAALGFDNVHLRCGDGSLGWPEHAPYRAIAVAAVGPRPPPALLAQLEIGGRLVMPIGPDGDQILVRLTRTGKCSHREEPLVDVRFVPLIGAQGYDRVAELGPGRH